MREQCKKCNEWKHSDSFDEQTELGVCDQCYKQAIRSERDAEILAKIGEMQTENVNSDYKKYPTVMIALMHIESWLTQSAQEGGKG